MNRQITRLAVTGMALIVALVVATTRGGSLVVLVLLVAAFGAFLAFLDSTIVNVAFPDIQRTFPESSLSTLSWVLNAYNIVLAAFLVAAGRFADLLGRKRVFIVGVVIFTVASVLCAVAGTVGQALVLNTPGSTTGSVECLEAVIDVIGHALDLMAGGRPH